MRSTTYSHLAKMEKTKKTHVEKIAERIKDVGYVDNFWAIETKTTYRLGARIFNMKELGWEFRTEKKGKNWYYYPTKCPSQENNLHGNSLVNTSVEVKKESVSPVDRDTRTNNLVRMTGNKWTQ